MHVDLTCMHFAPDVQSDGNPQVKVLSVLLEAGVIGKVLTPVVREVVVLSTIFTEKTVGGILLLRLVVFVPLLVIAW